MDSNLAPDVAFSTSKTRLAIKESISTPYFPVRLVLNLPNEALYASRSASVCLIDSLFLT